MKGQRQVTGEPVDRSRLGQRLRDLRNAKGWTLADVSQRTGLAISTISKAERGVMALAFDKFAALAHGLGHDVGELFENDGQRFKPGSLLVTRAKRAPEHETEGYVYRMLSTSLRHKRMLPMFGRVKAHDVREFKEQVRHAGEEFLFVLSGRLDVHIDGRAPIRLNRHDCIYFDSGIGHLYVSAGRQDTEILVVCVEDEPGSAQPRPTKKRAKAVSGRRATRSGAR